METERLTERLTDKHTDRQTVIVKTRYISIHIDVFIRTEGQINGLTEGQTNVPIFHLSSAYCGHQMCPL